MSHPLDRPVWSCLTGAQAELARGGGAARRIDPAYGPFAAARDRSEPSQRALGALLRPGETVWLVEPEPWPPPFGTRPVRAARLAQMVAVADPSSSPSTEDIVALGESDAPAMRDLAAATQPGPWAEATHRYGRFYGIRHGGRLIAMAGERMRPEGHAEVSGVCTDPAFRGRGYAAALMLRVMAGLRARGLTPFLHAYAANTGAIALYETLGFRVRRELTVTVVGRG